MEDAGVPPVIHLMQDRTRVVFDPQRISKRLAEAARGLEASVSVEELTEDVIRSVFDGISVPEVYRVKISRPVLHRGRPGLRRRRGAVDAQRDLSGNAR